MSDSTPNPGRAAECELGLLFLRSGRVRQPDPAQLGAHPEYHKGWEVRLSLARSEVQHVSRLVTLAGLRPGRAYAKGRRLILPIYGYESVELFLCWAEEMRHAQ